MDRLADDHAAARAFAEAVAERAPAAVDLAAVETNIVVLTPATGPPPRWPRPPPTEGVAVSALGPRMLRAVTHLDVSQTDCVRAGQVVGRLLGGSDRSAGPAS